MSIEELTISELWVQEALAHSGAPLLADPTELAASLARQMRIVQESLGNVPFWQDGSAFAKALLEAVP